jgi:branched-subunit amino acid ABC-type transport system permease component
MALTETIRTPQRYLEQRSRWRPVEFAFWLAALLPFYFVPDYLQLASQIAITALFALSLDLILGYAGIVSLGHAAFFGVGAYTAGIMSKYGWGEPLTGLMAAAVTAGIVGYATSFIIARFRHLALIMLTLGSDCCSANWRTARAGSPAASTACRGSIRGSCSASFPSISTATPPMPIRFPSSSCCSSSRGD